MEFELVDALPVADVVLDAVHGCRAEDSNDSAKSGGCQKWLAGLGIVRPVNGIFIFILTRSALLNAVASQMCPKFYSEHLSTLDKTQF